MSQQVTIEERLSALYDGEISSFEGHRLTSELLKDSDRKARWLRYQTMSDVLRGEISGNIAENFADRVMKSIDSEPVYEKQETEKASVSWLKPAAGFALAASVAAISIFALQFATKTSGSGVEMAATEAVETSPVTQQPQQLAEIPQPNASDNAMVRQVNTTEVPVTAAITEAPLTDPRMDSYLATHAEFASRPGFLSRVRIVGYNDDPVDEER